MPLNKEVTNSNNLVFNGNIYFFHAFDVGEDINFDKIEKSQVLLKRPLILPKYFKKYHIPLAVELPNTNESANCISAKLHSFGVISLIYKIPFQEALEELRKNINDIDQKYQEQSISDAAAIFKKIKEYIINPKFYHLRSYYPVIQVNPSVTKIDAPTLKEQFGSIIASLLRYENEFLSEYQKDEILESAMGYYRGDFIVIDSDAAFVADEEFEEVLDLFEFANIQQLELRYFDKVLDQQLNIYYEQREISLPFKTYLPLLGGTSTTAIDLGKLKVDVSVVTERIENSVKLAGEAYFTEIYSMLVRKLDINNWKESLTKKLEILEDVQEIYQNQINNIREDLLSVLIIILIFIELIVGILSYFKE